MLRVPVESSSFTLSVLGSCLLAAVSSLSACAEPEATLPDERGGAAGVGGDPSSGGQQATGGALTAGGAASGGAPPTGGTVTIGGAVAAGGQPASGGALASGGLVSGGAPPTGGTGGTFNDTVCGTADEDGSVLLGCPAEQVIDEVVFASYGDPVGDCGAWAKGSCDAATAVAVVEGRCSGRRSCVVPATNAVFGDPCSGTAKRLAVEVTCVVGEPIGTDGAPFKGVANSSCPQRQALGVSWYYNWMQNENEACADGNGGEFVPMVWGHPGAEQTAAGIASAVDSFAGRGHTHVLAFNEPDNCPDAAGNGGQACIPVADAISLMPAFAHPSLRIGSPATAANANPGQAWFTDYMTQLNADASLRNDFLAVHWYGWNAGSCDASAAQLESYLNWVEGFAGDRPIWLTEWGCLNASAPDEATVVSFYLGALAVFERHPRIERYAWYPWAANCHLVDDDGSLTALGAAYAAAPATR